MELECQSLEDVGIAAKSINYGRDVWHSECGEFREGRRPELALCVNIVCAKKKLPRRRINSSSKVVRNGKSALGAS